jgi:hypothetical protein
MWVELAPGSFVNLDRLTAVRFGRGDDGALTASCQTAGGLTRLFSVKRIGGPQQRGTSPWGTRWSGVAKATGQQGDRPRELPPVRGRHPWSLRQAGFSGKNGRVGLRWTGGTVCSVTGMRSRLCCRPGPHRLGEQDRGRAGRLAAKHRGRARL